MHTAKINNIEYTIPVSWSDGVTFGQASQVIKYDGNKPQQLKELTGIPLEIINKTLSREVAILFNNISFVDNTEAFDSQEVKPEYKYFDFGSLEYGMEQEIKKFINDQITGHELAAKAIKIITDIDINDKPFLEWIGTANFFLSKLIISIIVTPSLENINQAMSKCKLGSTDYKSLEALRLMLNSQEEQQSEAQ